MSSERGTETHIPVQPGERIADRYVVERVIGSGGMGVVVAARHEQLGQTVAIKFMSVPSSHQEEAVLRFVREAKATASLRSEHVTRVMDAGSDDRGRYYIAMEYLEGQDLGSVIRQEGPLSMTTAVGYVLQACEAIAEAHSQGIIHRDLKPENIFLTKRVDGSPLIKVLDFGVSKIVASADSGDMGDSGLSGRTSLLGSPAYMSPEQIRTPSEIDGRSDVWALGVVLYFLTTARLPFDGNSVPELLADILSSPPPLARTVCADFSPELDQVIQHCLTNSVSARMASVGALANALTPWAPRWARDSASRAVRVSGGTVQLTPSPPLDESVVPRQENVVTSRVWHARPMVRVSLFASLAIVGGSGYLFRAANSKGSPLASSSVTAGPVPESASTASIPPTRVAAAEKKPEAVVEASTELSPSAAALVTPPLGEPRSLPMVKPAVKRRGVHMISRKNMKRTTPSDPLEGRR